MLYTICNQTFTDQVIVCFFGMIKVPESWRSNREDVVAITILNKDKYKLFLYQTSLSEFLLPQTTLA